MTSAIQKLCGTGGSSRAFLRIAPATKPVTSGLIRASSSMMNTLASTNASSLLMRNSNLRTDSINSNRLCYSTTPIAYFEQNENNNDSSSPDYRPASKDSTGRKPTLYDQFHQLVERSEQFFEDQSAGATKSTLEHQQLLANWLKIAWRLKNERHLRKGAFFADRLAYSILKIRTSNIDAVKNFLDSMDDDDADDGLSPESNSGDESGHVPNLVQEVIRVWAKLGEAIKAEDLLRFQVQNYDRTGEYPPESGAYCAVIDALSKDIKGEKSVRGAVYWFRQMKDPKERQAYNSVLNAFANVGSPIKAEKYFTRMKENPGVGVDNFTFATMMKAWVRSGRDDSQRNIEKLLQELKDMYQAEGCPERLLPNTVIHGSAILLAAPERAEALLRELQDNYERTGNKKLQPTVRLYVNVMKRWADFRRPGEVERLLGELQAGFEAGNEAMRPNIQCFITIISAYTKIGTPESVQRAEQLLNQLESEALSGKLSLKLNNHAYNIVIDAIGRTNQDPEKAEELFERVKRLAGEHNLPNLRPDVFTYTALMRAWIGGKQPGFSQKVESLLEEIENDDSLRPDIVVYGVVLNALSKSDEDDAGMRGEAIMRRMDAQGLRPNRICYNCIIGIYANQGNAAKAKEILKWMEDEAANGNYHAKTSARDYSMCISAIAAEGLAGKEHLEEAQRLFHTVSERYKAGNRDFRTSPAILTSLMVVLANSEVMGKAKIAKEIFDVASENDIQLDRRTYNALLKACSEERGTPEEQLEALELAVTSFQLMRQGETGVDKSTFVYLMLCCRHLIPDKTEKAAAMEEFFQNCCDAGLVTEDVASHFSHFVPGSPLISEFLDPNGTVDLGRIPPEWTKSVY